MKALEGNNFNKKVNSTKNRKLRKRKIAWYNPPYNADVRSNLAKQFFEILDKNFPKKHRYYSIINRHTVKLSYSTTPNLEKIIAGLNGSKMRKNKDINERDMNIINQGYREIL